MYMAALAVALVLVGGILSALGASPLVAYGTVLRSSLGSPGGLGQTLNKATPLLLGGLAVALGMRGGLLNIGVDGQIYLGAVLATGAAFMLGSGVVPVVGLPLVLLAGLVGGALAVLPAALLRAAWGVNEVFVTVMLNFIMVFLVEFLTTGPWNDPMAGEAISRPIAAAARLPVLLPQLGAHAGILLALGLALALSWLLRRTVLGYQVRAMGDNPVAARVGGINLPVVSSLTLVCSGAIAGLAGAIEVSGYHQRLILGLSPGYGYMAILLAVLGKRGPIGVTLAACGFAVLLTGSDSLQRSVNLPASAVLLFQSVILLSVVVAESLRGARLGRGLRWRRPVGPVPGAG